MSVRFSWLCVDSADPRRLAAFWRDVLGYELEAEDDEDEVALKAPEGSGPSLLFLKVPEAKTVKNRLHLDLTPPPGEQDAEVERIVGLGARHVDIGQGEQTWVVLGDPEGNEFCVLRGKVD